MTAKIIKYPNKIAVYTHFKHKDKLNEVKWGARKFNWRTKAWDFYPGGRVSLDDIINFIKDVFGNCSVQEGIKNISSNKKTLYISGEKIYIDCPEDFDIAIQSIPSSSFDKIEQKFTCDLSMDNLWTLKRIIPGVTLSTDEETDSAYKGFLRKKRDYDALTKELNEIKEGVDVPHDHTFCMDPFDHQRVIFNFLLKAPKGGLIADCGTGKTFCVINMVSHRIRKKEAKSALVVCPLSVMYNAWASDIEKFKTGDSYSVLWTPQSGKKRKQYVEDELKKDYNFYIINFDGLTSYLDILKEKKFDYVIVDESSKIKNYKSKIFKACVAVSEDAKFRTIMSATPAPNSPVEAWPQFYFLDRGETLGRNFKDFEAKFFQKVEITDRNMHKAFTKFELKPGAVERLNEMISKRAFRIKSSDCQDLPKTQNIDIRVQMTPRQKKHYKEIQEQLFTILDSGDVVEAANKMVSIGKLRQVTSGFIFSEAGSPEEWIMKIDNNPKVQACDDLVEQIIGSSQKVIIWAEFKTEILMLKERYKEYGAVDYFGGTSGKNKMVNLEKFKNEKETRVLIAHPQSLGHGVTLIEANYCIYYSLNYSQENYYQSTKRIHRAGQTKNCFYYHIVIPNTVDILMKKVVQKKTKMQSKLIDGSFNKDDILKEMED